MGRNRYLRMSIDRSAPDVEIEISDETRRAVHAYALERTGMGLLSNGTARKLDSGRWVIPIEAEVHAQLLRIHADPDVAIRMALGMPTGIC